MIGWLEIGKYVQQANFWSQKCVCLRTFFHSGWKIQNRQWLQLTTFYSFNTLLYFSSFVCYICCMYADGSTTAQAKVAHRPVAPHTLYIASIWQRSSLQVYGQPPNCQRTANTLSLLDHKLSFRVIKDKERWKHTDEWNVWWADGRSTLRSWWIKKIREEDRQKIVNQEMQRISKEEVKAAMKRIKRGKVVGPDYIPNSMESLRKCTYCTFCCGSERCLC